MGQKISNCRVRPENLERFLTDVFLKVGMPEGDAGWTSGTLIQSELWGAATHGIVRVPYYVRRFQSKLINPEPTVSTVTEAGAIAILDGDNGMGQVVAKKAMEDCIRRARSHNVGIVLLKESNHFGVAATYTLMAANEGMVGFCATNTAAVLAPWGGRKPLVGNNPIAIAVPADPPIFLDMAPSAVARGNIIIAARAGKSVPEGWGVDAEGKSTTNPNAILNGGSLSPVGNHKGSGLSIMIDAILGALAGGKFGYEGKEIMDMSGQMHVTHFFGAINVESLVPLGGFRDSVNAFANLLRQSPRAQGVERIFMPGEIGLESEKILRKEGIPLSPERQQELSELSESLGIPRLETFKSAENRG